MRSQAPKFRRSSARPAIWDFGFGICLWPQAALCSSVLSVGKVSSPTTSPGAASTAADRVEPVAGTPRSVGFAVSDFRGVRLRGVRLGFLLFWEDRFGFGRADHGRHGLAIASSLFFTRRMARNGNQKPSLTPRSATYLATFMPPAHRPAVGASLRSLHGWFLLAFTPRN